MGTEGLLPSASQPCGVASPCNPAYVQPPTFGVFTWELLCPPFPPCPHRCARSPAGCSKTFCSRRKSQHAMRQRHRRQHRYAVVRTCGTGARPWVQAQQLTPLRPPLLAVGHCVATGRSTSGHPSPPRKRLLGHLQETTGLFCRRRPWAAETPLLHRSLPTVEPTSLRGYCGGCVTRAPASWSSPVAWLMSAQNWTGWQLWKDCKPGKSAAD